ncbi:hypothetical protein ABZ297_45520 [Nonomuraea sp. NPDC005983]|uniref:hypothetical protein n=1 Tax=Nonomuraea sp. NPDC005983 TaxID=3155595 RepID=UPI0033BC5425
MHPGNEYEPPTTPYPMPHGQYKPQMPPPTMPVSPPPPPKRRGWILPVVAVLVVVLVGGGAGAYLLLGRRSAESPAPAPGRSSQSVAVAGAPATMDACSMVPKQETERLVPDATVAKDSRDSEYEVNFSCGWNNQRISFGEYWRSREIAVKIAQHRGDGAKTGRAMAQSSYEVDYGGAKYGETAKPTLEKGEKEYVSPVKDVPGVGDGAFAQYTWRRSGSMLWYAFGQAQARVDDVTIEVKYQAGQQRKDAKILTNDSAQAVTEENAIREASMLIGHVAKGVAAWKAQHPNVLAQPDKAQTTAPTATPTPSPTNLAIFPPACQAMTQLATELVPDPTPRAQRVEAGNDAQTECRWLNLDVPGDGGVKKIRSAVITTHRFTNRAGAEDKPAAQAFYVGERGRNGVTADSSMGGITWSKLSDVTGLGEAAYSQYVQIEHGDVFNASGSVMVRQGPLVIQIEYAGAQRPKDEPANSSKVTLMPDAEARGGALRLAKAYLAELAKKPIGS